jgi:hypothetical protein
VRSFVPLDFCVPPPAPRRPSDSSPPGVGICLRREIANLSRATSLRRFLRAWRNQHRVQLALALRVTIATHCTAFKTGLVNLWCD